MADEQKDQKDEQEPKTRTRSTASAKAEQTEEEKSQVEARKAEADKRAQEKAEKEEQRKTEREEKRKAAEAKREQDKEAREAKKKEDAERKEREKAEKAEAKEREKVEARQRQIDNGEIIFANRDGAKLEAEDATDEDGDLFTYVKAEPKKETVANRARDVIRDLMEEATEVPMSGKELADKYEGGTVQWVSFFGMLRVIGWVQPYRFRTGARGDGESGLAYLWIGPGPDELELVESTLNGESSEEEADQEAQEAAEEVAA